MGTSYYANINTCPTCKRPEDKIHLGKSSFGWKFSFQYNAGLYYKNVQEMREWMKDKDIYDEYGEKTTHDEFWKMVKEKQPKGKSHAVECPSERDFVIDGYSFSDIYFT